ncbi:SusC/RagA family TonB-linked outer membrane protein [Filimonas effusa]|nr:SusC/RagA family TonB-linked outer membrane protein [Filimonas effusa]
MKQILLVMGVFLTTAAPIALQAQDSTKQSSSATASSVRKLVVGKVTNDKGEPLSDVTVQIKGSQTATKTGSNGSYSLNVPSNGTLVFSFVGMGKQEISVAGRSTVDVQMAAVVESNLEEVIVVGYGTQKAKNVTGSVVSLDVKKLEDMPVATVGEALRGQAPGLNVSGGSTRPGTNPTISIRQQFAFGKDGGSSLPLVIIDDVIQLDPNTGLPSMDQFNLLDPSEVESITVLRDGSAAIYGSRASQGAILVKTKKGKNGPAKISYSGKFQRSDAVSHIKTMSAYEHGIFANRFGRASGWAESNMFSAAELESMKSLNYDWLKEAWRASTNAQHSLNVNGGSDRGTYFAGITYLTQGANLGDQDYNRWTFRTGTEVKVMNNLKLTATISANNNDLLKSFTKLSMSGDPYTQAGGEQADYNVLNHMPKYIPWQFNVNGTDRYISPALGPYRVLSSPAGQNNMAGWNYFGQLKNGSNTNTKTFSYNTNFGLQYDIPYVKGLSIKGTYAITYSTENTEQVSMPITLAIGTNTNQTDRHLYGDQTTWNVAENKNGSRVSYTDVTGKIQQTNFYVNYDRTFGFHNVSAVGSIEKGIQNYGKKVLLYDNPIANGYNGTSSSAGTLNTGNTITNRTEGGNLSYLGRVSYNYRSKYMVQFQFRSDASSKFAPENYWGFFPSVSVGWNISSEDWFKNSVSWVDNLKIRASLGKSGNDNLTRWKWMQLYEYAADKGLGFGTNGGALVGGVTPSVTPNRDVKWDRTIKQNIGIDAAFLKNRLSVSIDGYYDKIRDMLTAMAGQIGVPVSVGGAFAEQNYASLNAWGTDITVNWKDKVGNVNYGISMNYSWGDNKVVKYFPIAYNYPSTNQRQEGVSTIYPAWGFQTWKGTSTGDGLLRTQADIDNYWNYLTELATAAGTSPAYMGNTQKSFLKTGMLAYEDQAGNLNSTDKTIAGKNGQILKDQDFVKLAKKNITRAITTNLNLDWKGLTFQAQIATSWGGYNSIDYVKQNTASTSLFWSHESYLNDMFDPVDNPNGKYPNLAYYDQNSVNSDFWQISSFRCVIRSLSVGYALPKDLVRKARLDNARVFLSGMNLWDLYNPYPDKYRNMYDVPTLGYPTLRTWALGVNLSF